ncbi:hypothetical protein NQD34_016488 [Periophthalmus magnuspinnatus]|nr:hypothetical protein NQD34_016488 [Periophthalmus magnuspinnatus]
MSTKAEQFASKIRYLQEYHNRVQHNIYPVPSGTDIANTLKYFSQTLLSILSRTGRKENQEASNLAVPMTMCLFPVPFPLTPSLRPQVSSINPTVTRSLLYSVLRDAPSDRAGQQSRDAQLSEYPSLDYQGLYVTLVTLLDLVPLLQHGQHDLGQSIFYTTTCLLPFLSDDILSTLPYTMISTLATFPPFLHKDIIEYLSTSFLPMAILGSTRREGGVPAYVNLSASSMLMIAMQYTSNPVYHCQLLECLMKYKQEVWKDLLYVISYGPSQVKPPAVQMLFHYWPNLKPPGAISEYRGLQYTDPTLSVALGDKPPPLYICEECSQRIAGTVALMSGVPWSPASRPAAAGRHGNRPVRYCKRCHVNHHSEVGAAAETHLYQTSPPPINTRECGAEELVCTVEAVISLLKEAEIHAEQREFELNRRRQMGLSSSHHSLDNIEYDNKEDDQHDQRLLSQFGIWFLVSLCTPNENTPTESLARLVSMVFQWFHSTAYMMDDEVGSLVEKLKPQFVTKWLKTVCEVRFDVMVMCLLPKPAEFARVGGYWDKSCSAVTQLKEGLNRILCLIPYNVISQPLWECFMPEWLEAIRTEVPDNQLKEFREVLSKMFDIELCPLPFSMEEMFGFISCRFSGYPASVQEQALLWLHVLSELDIVVPLQLLIGMFSDGVNSLKELANQRKARADLSGNTGARRVSVVSDPGRRGQHNTLSPFPSPFRSPFRSPLRCSPFKNLGHATANCALDLDCDDDDMNLGCFILMFDLILKQMELQDDGVMLGLDSSLGKDIVGIINNVFQAPWGGSHTCQKDEKALECSLCQSSILCYQLGCELLERLTPREEIRVVEPTDSLEETLILPQPPDFSLGTETEENEEGENPNGTNADNPSSQSPDNPLEKVAVLCRFLDIGAVTKNHLLKYSLAHAFCCFLASVEDVNPSVATRARLLLDTIKRPALQGLCLCMDFQFDTVVRDRPIILSKLLLLHFLKKDIPALSWEFFVNRFETLSLEAQLHLDCNKEFPFPTTITAVRTNVANLSDAAMWKIKRARFARNRQEGVRSLRDSVKGTPQTDTAESKRAFSLPESLGNRLRQSPSPEDDSIIKDLLPEDAGIDHQTVHQLIMVLMKFMAKDQSSAEADLGSAKAFNTVKRHLYVLLGYDQQEGCFMIAPQKMRTSTCFNAFIAGIAQVLDYNISLGKQLLPLVVQVLKYCTCPQLRHYFQQPPRCSLWALKPHIRQMWLKALLVILYKYPYRDMDGSKVVLHLIHITINTLNAQYHSCRAPCHRRAPVQRQLQYEPLQREGEGVFDESDVHDTPTGAANKESQTFFARLKRIGGSKSVKYQPVELNAKRSDIELSEYRETSALQDSILHCVREESVRKKRLQAMHKQKSLDISNTDSLLFNLDEHRRKSCIDRCDLQAPPALLPPSSSSSQGRHHGKGSSDGSSVRAIDLVDRRGSRGGHSDISKPVIPEVRLSCMETFEDKQDQDSPADSAQEKEDQDLIDLSSDCTSIPEKHSLLSMSDTDSLVFEPLPPLRIVESDEEFDLNTIIASKLIGSPKISTSPASSNTLRLSPVVQVSFEDGSFDKNVEEQTEKKDVEKKPDQMTPSTSIDLSEKPENVSHESQLTLKQKRDLLKKTPHVPDNSLDDAYEGSGTSGRTVFLDIPEDKTESPSSPEKSKSNSNDEEEDGDDEEDEDMGDEVDSDPKPENTEESEESEFKIQIVPRQRKQRKIAVSAIQREYLDISFNTFDKLGTETIVEAAQYRAVKRGSLGALTMSQLMKRQLEHQSSAPHNISTWDTGPTKTSLLSAPSTVSMFVPAPEEFIDEQPTTMSDKCRDCAAVLEEYDEETLGLAVVVLSMFIHLSPDLAAPMLLDIMQSVGRLASSANFSGQAESMLIPGNVAGVAKQFLRCMFHQLAPNGILPQLFQSNIKDGSFLRTLASSLIDFNELSSVAALNMLLEGLNNKKSLPAGSTMLHCLENIATFMEALPMDSPSNLWTTICNQFQTFLTKLPSVLPLKCPMDSSLRIIICLLKIPTTNATRERDKFYMSRIVVLELLQALKFKSPLPDTNLLLLVQFVCADIGTRLAESTIIQKHMISTLPGCTTAAMECMRQYISELLDFIADMHTLTKLKSHMKACCQPLHEDTFGGNLKVGLAQVAAMEISKGNHRDNKAVLRYLPWLYHPPSTMQQGPKEFIECVSHIRQLSWLLLGALTHCALHQGSTSCMPIPLDAGSHIADHLIVILIGFPEQSKTSVLHMCSLFHAFMFAQLWTIYCEQAAAAPSLQNQNQTEFSSTAILTGLEFWSRVTPSILQLMAHNKVMVEMVCLHVISLMEALQECNSTIFVKLIPMWLPMIQSNLKHLSAGLRLRLQAIQNRVNHQCLQGQVAGCPPCRSAQMAAVHAVQNGTDRDPVIGGSLTVLPHVTCRFVQCRADKSHALTTDPGADSGSSGPFSSPSHQSCPLPPLCASPAGVYVDRYPGPAWPRPSRLSPIFSPALEEHMRVDLMRRQLEV